VAAANRAQAAVAEFQYAPGIEEALYIMGESYDKLGLTQLRDDARRVLDKNFPNSAYASGGANRKKPWWQLW
jgi:outer membrane protein assembly factor BamD